MVITVVKKMQFWGVILVAKKGQYRVVITMFKKMQFWVVIRVVNKRQF